MINPSDTDLAKPASKTSCQAELFEFLGTFPDKSLFLLMVAAWCVVFHFLGNSTYGYVDTSSLFAWLNYDYRTADDEHGRLIPFVVLGLFWYERNRFMAVEKKTWWPAMVIVILAMAMHLVGFRVQQVRISIIAFFLGVYGIMGLVWGPKWLRAAFFPYVLFAFCFPLGTVGNIITVPLRIMAASITAWFCNHILSIDVIREGTMLFNSRHTYEYEVAAACSGLRSLIAVIALTTIQGFLSFKSPWRRLIIIGSGVPLAVCGNVFRLIMIIVVSQAFGAKAGLYVHASPWLSLLPYIPVFVGMVLLGYLLREKSESVPKESSETNKGAQ